MKEGGQTPVALKFSCTKTPDCPEALKIKGLKGAEVALKNHRIFLLSGGIHV